MNVLYVAVAAFARNHTNSTDVILWVVECEDQGKKMSVFRLHKFKEMMKRWEDVYIFSRLCKFREMVKRWEDVYIFSRLRKFKEMVKRWEDVSIVSRLHKFKQMVKR